MIDVFCQDRNGCYKCNNFYRVGKEVRTFFTENHFEVLGVYESEDRAMMIIKEMASWGKYGIYWMPET